jgi:hypothetical protein
VRSSGSVALGPGGHEPEEIGTTHFAVDSAGGDAGKIEAALAKLPDDKLIDIYGAGTKIAAVGNSVHDYFNDWGADGPRGWSDGANWSVVPGVFDPSSKTVLIATSDRFPNGSVNLALHEIGHAYDAAMGGLSDSSDFTKAYEAAKGGLSAYFLQAGSAGRQETFAESFAAFFSDNEKYAADHPSLIEYWRQQNGVKKVS